MKKPLILILLIFCVMGLAIAQSSGTETSPILRNDQLPPQVSTGFDNKNPEIEHATWTQDGENYAATFEKEGETIRSEFNYDGTWIGDFWIIEKTDIPEAVIREIKENFNEYVILESYKVDTEEGTHYEFLVSDGEQQNSLRFDEEGNRVEIAESMKNEKMNE